MRKKQKNLLHQIITSPFTLLAISLYLGVSLYNGLSGNEDSLGSVGAFLGSFMIRMLGVSAWGIPLLLGYVAVKQIKQSKVNNRDKYRLPSLLILSTILLGSKVSGGLVGNSLWEVAASSLGEVPSFIAFGALFMFFAAPSSSKKFLSDANLFFRGTLKPSQLKDEKQNGVQRDGPDNWGPDPQLSPEPNMPIKEHSPSEEVNKPADDTVKPKFTGMDPKPSTDNVDDIDKLRPVSNQWGGDLPKLEFLEAYETTVEDQEEIRDSAGRLDGAFRQYQIKAKVEETLVAPMVLTHLVETRGSTKISEIERHLSDVSRYMGLPENAVRLNLDMEGKEGKLAIEVPLSIRRKVGLLELMQSVISQKSHARLPLRLGLNTMGATICEDLAEMPHLLVAGSTGSGKSIALNSMLVSLLLNCSPEKLRLVLIDPKMVEFSHFRGLPHLHGDVITESDEAIDSLNGLTDIMDHRYRLLNESGFRNIAEYNEAENNGGGMPHVVVVIDELADLLMVEGKIAEEPIVRLAQKARAAGIHLIMATQRPTADVITGLIKTNVPARLAFRVSSNVDSRVILNQKGAESLQGKGDALFLNPAAKGLERLQSPMVSLEEIERVTGFWKSFC